jgi:hypothetical protein
MYFFNNRTFSSFGNKRGVTAFSSFWSIIEVFEQRERVRKGWFPENPKRKKRENLQ